MCVSCAERRLVLEPLSETTAASGLQKLIRALASRRGRAGQTGGLLGATMTKIPIYASAWAFADVVPYVEQLG